MPLYRLLLVASMLVGGVARGDEGWRATYREGSRLFDVGDYHAALDAFKRAYVAHDEPDILFDIGECQRMMGNKAEAAHAYRSYLRHRPEAQNRSAVEALIAQLEGGKAPSPSSVLADAPPPKSAASASPPPRASAPKPQSASALPPSPPPSASAPPPSPPPPAPPIAATVPPPAQNPPGAPDAATGTTAPHGSIYDPWHNASVPMGTARIDPTAPTIPPPVPATTAIATAPPAPAVTAASLSNAPAPAPAAAEPPAGPPPPAMPPPSTAPPQQQAWMPNAPPPERPHKSKAWIAAVVVPCVAVLAVSIGVTAWYLSPAPSYTQLGAIR